MKSQNYREDYNRKLYELLQSVGSVITLGKLIDLLFLFCLPLLSILFLKTKRNDLARPVMGTIFLVYIYTSTECKTLKGEQRMIFIFNL